MAGPLAVVGSFSTVDQVMLAAAEQIGGREAFVEVATGRRLTFGEWVAAGRSLARQLRDLGVESGDVVAVALSPSIDYVIGCVGALFAGAVVSGINTRLGPREVAGIFDRCSPTAVIADPSFAMPAGHAPIVITPAEFELVGSPLDPSPVVQPGDPAVIIWTSGTTGLPKGAWFDHRNLEAAVHSAGEMTHAFDRRLGGLPLAHAGSMAKIWEQFAMGFSIVLTPVPWTAQMMLQVLTSERINVGAGVPTQFVKLLELPETAGADFSALRVCLSATAPAAPELIERICDTLGAPVIVRYAMTESPSITGTDPEDPPEIQFRTVGRPQHGMAVRVVDDTGSVVSVGVVGRVQISGPCVMRGYWGDPVQTAAVLGDDGWLTSGDLGRFDADGNLSLVGRAGDMYIRGGYNVYPLEVENVLVEHPAIAAAAVIGRAAATIGEIGVAFLVLEPGHRAPTRDEVRTWVRERLADYKAPDEVVVLDALPLTPMAKVDKQALAGM